MKSRSPNIYPSAFCELQSPYDRQPFAPAWHTAVVLLLLLLLVAWSGLHHVLRPDHMNHRITSYIAISAAEWLITAFIWLGWPESRLAMRILTGAMSTKLQFLLRDVGLAIAFLLVGNTLLAMIGHLMHATPNESLRNLLPHGGPEVGCYLFLALTAAICEEIIYRGHLQRQFTRWSKRASIGIVLQGVIFGASHAYQGKSMMLTICVYGCLFGLLARWRGSLLPGMMAHFLQDGVGGLLLAAHGLK
jgi:uncharacterized protein